MSRIYFRSSKGRTPMLATPTRLTRSVKASIDGAEHSHSGKSVAGKSRVPPKYLKQKNKRKLSVTSDEASDEDNGVAVDEEEDADDEDGDDEIDVQAPSYASIRAHMAGPQSNKRTKARVEEIYADNESVLFGDSEDDDEVYGVVDNISDSEEVSEADLEGFEEQAIANEFASGRDAVQFDYLGDIDGNSAYGAVDVQEFSSTSESSNEADAAVSERRVHFDASIEDVLFPADPISPTMEMKPLPSSSKMYHPQGFSQEELLQSPRTGVISADHRAFFGDPDEDSDLTDDDPPYEAHTAPSALQNEPLERHEEHSSSKKKGSKSPPRRRGPVRGIFEIDPHKPWAVLDPSGKKIVFLPAPSSNRHEWLDEKAEVAASANTSPHSSFATLPSDYSNTSSQDHMEQMVHGPANVMMAGLNNGDAGQQGQAIGPPEAFYAPVTSDMGNYVFEPSDFEASDEDNLGRDEQGNLLLEELIEFDDDDPDEIDDDETSTQPIFVPAAAEAPFTPAHKKSDSYSHLNSDNIMSFRRNTNANSTTHINPWDFEPRALSPTFKLPTSPITRKRKARSPPYQGSVYEGVTPVERKIITPKRRRGNTLS